MLNYYKANDHQQGYFFPICVCLFLTLVTAVFIKTVLSILTQSLFLSQNHVAHTSCYLISRGGPRTSP
jgi:hypothetical protein